MKMPFVFKRLYIRFNQEEMKPQWKDGKLHLGKIEIDSAILKYSAMYTLLKKFCIANAEEESVEKENQ